MKMKTNIEAIRSRLVNALGWWAAILPGRVIDRVAGQIENERGDAWVNGREHQRGLVKNNPPSEVTRREPPRRA